MIISIVHISFTCTADKKRDILEFFEQMNFEQMIPTLDLVYAKNWRFDVKFSFTGLAGDVYKG